MEADKRAFEIHFEVFYITFSVYMDFEALTKEIFGFGDESPVFRKLMQGFNNIIYDCDSELWHLVNLLVEFDLADVFACHPLEMIPELERKELGRKWLRRFQNFLALYGRRSTVG